MKELNKEEMLKIDGGVNFSASMMSAIYKTIVLLYVFSCKISFIISPLIFSILFYPLYINEHYIFKTWSINN